MYILFPQAHWKIYYTGSVEQKRPASPVNGSKDTKIILYISRSTINVKLPGNTNVFKILILFPVGH
jgi:hypothetical protein